MPRKSTILCSGRCPARTDVQLTSETLTSFVTDMCSACVIYTKRSEGLPIYTLARARMLTKNPNGSWEEVLKSMALRDLPKGIVVYSFGLCPTCLSPAISGALYKYLSVQDLDDTADIWIYINSSLYTMTFSNLSDLFILASAATDALRNNSIKC